MDPLLHECYLHCMNLILRFVKMTYDGQLIETCRQDKNKIKYNIVFDWNQKVFCCHLVKTYLLPLVTYIIT